jgi:phosphotransferase system  glucose/maltose/N-acetylglucosamine-specific IIC component
MPDWTDQVADSIEQAVAKVRDKTVVPVERIVAYVIAGLFLLFLLTAIGILASVFLFRLVDVYLPSGSWATWLVFGGVFMAFGALLLSLRR